MTRLLAPLLAAVPLAVALAGCAPSHQYTNEEVATVKDLEDVMWSQAQAADPAFKLIGKAALTDDDYAVATRAGERLKLTAPRMKASFSKGPEFDTFADALAAQADEVAIAAAAKDAVKTTAALASTKATCKSCHSKFR